MRSMDKWKGYTLDQLDTQRAMVKLKIALEQERLRQSFTPAIAQDKPLNSFSRYISLGRQIVKGAIVIKNFVSIVRSFRNKR